jgi:hypothetical protein
MMIFPENGGIQPFLTLIRFKTPSLDFSCRSAISFIALQHQQ